MYRFLLLLAAFLLPFHAAQAGDKGRLRIFTEPGDAQLFINGKRKGNSPADAGQSFTIQLDEGEHYVQALKPGSDIHEFYGERRLFVADDTLQTITISLEKRVSQTLMKRLLRKYAHYAPAPKMVAVPAGRFRMGCLESDKDCRDDEKPVLEMDVPAFEIGKHEVTFEEWDACFAQGGCERYPSDEGWGRADRPVINVSWNDIQQYLAWLNKLTGKRYRLPSEPEWEYAARAGANTVYSWGDAVGWNQANCDGCGSQWDNRQTAPVGSFAANPWGLFDMHGNVWEWVSGCMRRYEGASTEVARWHDAGQCGGRVRRGGSWYVNPKGLRAAIRKVSAPEYRYRIIGFRLARTL